MDAQVLISKINSANKIEDIIEMTDFKKLYMKIMGLIHPDVCQLPGANEAAQKMNDWRTVYEVGKSYQDDINWFVTNNYWVRFNSDCEDSKFINWSVENYRLFMQFKEESDKFFQQYLPKSCKLNEKIYEYSFEKRSIPLTELTLPEEHVRWILNRMIEYSSYLFQKGFSHCGLNPESVFIAPQNHGIQIVSFYHLTILGNKMGTISAKYKHWYPQSVFTTKVCTPDIDIECVKKIAIYLLGDKSGVGVKLKGKVSDAFLSFLQSTHKNPMECLSEYRELIQAKYPRQFYSLTI